MSLVHENGDPLNCIHCGQHIDLAEDTGDDNFYHVITGYYACNPTEPEEQAEPQCLWAHGCDQPGSYPLKEKVRNRDTDEILEENYLAFLCQRHLKVAALVGAGQQVPHTLLDPFVIEEMPG